MDARPANVNTVSELKPEPGAMVRGMLALATDDFGAPERVPVILVRGMRQGPTLWVQACAHGDEYAASWAVSSLAKAVDISELAGSLVLLPAIGGTAFKARQVLSPVDSGNFYRMLPGDSSGTYSEQIASAVAHEVTTVADYLIDVHSGTSVYHCIEFSSYASGLAESERARAMAHATGAKVIVERSVNANVGPGVLFTYATAQGIPALMISMGGHRRVEETFFAPLVNQCLSVMRHLEMIPGKQTEPEHVDEFDAVEFLVAMHGGFPQYEVQNGEWVERDQIVARIFNVFGDELEALRSPYGRAMLIESASGVIQQGEFAAELFTVAE